VTAVELREAAWKTRRREMQSRCSRRRRYKEVLSATLRWFTAGGTIRIAVRQLLQTWKLRHYDVIDDVITRKV